MAAKRVNNATQFVQVTNAHGVGLKDMATLSIQVDAMPTPWVADPSEVKTTVTRDAAGNSIVNIDISTLPQNVRAPLQLAYSRVYTY